MTPQAHSRTETDLIDQAVVDLSRRTGFPVTFGGRLVDGEVRITAVHGARTALLLGLRIRPEHGLGGRAMVELRPRMTSDYGRTERISHEYDDAILGEGIATLLAIPVVLDGTTHALLYAGGWADEPLGEIATAAAFQVADELAARLQADPAPVQAPAAADDLQSDSGAIPAGAREELRDIYAQLRVVAATESAAEVREVREALIVLAHRIAAVASGEQESRPDVRLSPRETDVLACAAVGATNADIAAQLGLQPGTVKAYLATAMSKLGASSRIAAVSEARRIGLLA